MDTADDKGNTALHMAALSGSLKLIQPIINTILHRHLSLDKANELGMTALMNACKSGHRVIANQLINGGASLSMRDNKNFRNAQEWMALKSATSVLTEVIHMEENKKRTILSNTKNGNPGRKLMYDTRHMRCMSAPLSGRREPQTSRARVLSARSSNRKDQSTPQRPDKKDIGLWSFLSTQVGHCRPRASRTFLSISTLQLQQPSTHKNMCDRMEHPLPHQMGGPDIPRLLELYAIHSSPNYRQGYTMEELKERIRNPPVPLSQRHVTHQKYNNVMAMQAANIAIKVFDGTGAMQRKHSLLRQQSLPTLGTTISSALLEESVNSKIQRKYKMMYKVDESELEPEV